MRKAAAKDNPNKRVGRLVLHEEQKHASGSKHVAGLQSLVDDARRGERGEVRSKRPLGSLLLELECHRMGSAVETRPSVNNIPSISVVVVQYSVDDVVRIRRGDFDPSGREGQDFLPLDSTDAELPVFVQLEAKGIQPLVDLRIFKDVLGLVKDLPRDLNLVWHAVRDHRPGCLDRFADDAVAELCNANDTRPQGARCASNRNLDNRSRVSRCVAAS